MMKRNSEKWKEDRTRRRNKCLPTPDQRTRTAVKKEAHIELQEQETKQNKTAKKGRHSGGQGLSAHEKDQMKNSQYYK
jgi:hypothetical protein